ncbi:hypothetical protein [Pedobacter aquatilis]|uniref:hypothetical protein n=1 Tax=Pedobacter aquatilis TaxID=351343 RepID=UPI00292CB8D5|nr:hypothetical protein [Pedobacter aquatilis]
MQTYKSVFSDLRFFPLSETEFEAQNLQTYLSLFLCFAYTLRFVILPRCRVIATPKAKWPKFSNICVLQSTVFKF